MSTTETLQVPGYQVVQFLGSGARSTIWQVRDCQTSEVFALKRAVKRQSNDDKFLQQAINEYEVGSKLNHENVRHIYRIRRIKRWLSLREVHLVMEFCEGSTVQEKRPTDVVEILRIFGYVAEALAYMNASGFVHADIKPNNIMVSPEGTVKIIDLGQSCPLGTVKERIQGTPDFIAPEQVHRRPLDARTDVFNFGAALYWTLTAKAIPTVLPKKGNVPMLADLSVKPPEQFNPQVPASLSKLVMDCIDVHPPNRPVSMRKLQTRLDLIAHTLKRNSAPPAESPDI